MGATSFGDLPLSDRGRSWDSDAADGRVRKWASKDGSGDKDQITWSKYRKAFFWYDSDDAENFGSYKLPFADVIDGDLTAVWRGVTSAAAAVNGSRGGVDLQGDTDAVKSTIGRYYSKAAKTYDDDSIETPWSESDSRPVANHRDDGPVLERRTRPFGQTDVTITRAEDDSAARFAGHASVFNSRTAIGNPAGWGWYEEIAPGAFTKTLQEGDARFLVDHDTRMLVARVSAGDLRLSEDGIGLAVDADLDSELSYVRDLVRNLDKRRITGMSFGFYVTKDDWITETVETSDGHSVEVEVRTIQEVRLLEVSAVTFPAYEETDAGLRKMCEAVRSQQTSPDAQSGEREPGETTRADDTEPGETTRMLLRLGRARESGIAARRPQAVTDSTNTERQAS